MTKKNASPVVNFNMPSKVSSTDMLMAICDENMEPSQTNACFKKTGIFKMKFSGDLLIDGEKKHLDVNLERKVKNPTTTVSITKNSAEIGTPYLAALQATMWVVWGIICKYTADGYDTTIGDADIEYTKLENGEYNVKAIVNCALVKDGVRINECRTDKCR